MTNWTRHHYFKLFLTVLFVGAFILMFVPFYAEILLAAIFAWAIEPSLGKFLRSKHVKWRPSVAVILSAMFVVIALPLSIVGYKIYGYFAKISSTGFQNTEVFQKLVVLKTTVLEKVDSLLTTMNLKESIDLQAFSEDGLNRIGQIVMSISTHLVTNVPSFLLSVFIFCAALYFFLAEAGPLKRLFYKQGLLSKSDSDQFIKILQTSSYMTVVTSIVLGFIQATVVTLGAAFTRAGDIVVIFVVTFFCSFIPVIGAGPVAFALGIYKFLMGEVGQGIALLVVSVIAGTTDNLVRPYLISSYDDDLHPIVSLLALIGALVIFGMPGLFLGPVIASVAVKAIPLFYGDGSGEAPPAVKKKS